MMASDPSPAETTTPDSAEFIRQLQQRVQPLWYPSETDAPLAVVVWAQPVAGMADVAAQLGVEAEGRLQSAAAFFERLRRPQLWAGGEPLHEQYGELQELMQAHLESLQGYRFGEVEQVLVVGGSLNDQQWVGIRTEAVQT